MYFLFRALKILVFCYILQEKVRSGMMILRHPDDVGRVVCGEMQLAPLFTAHNKIK
jgi:hypothetical protein